MISIISLVNICHHTKLLWHYWLYSICCTLYPCDYFITGRWLLLILFTFSPNSLLLPLWKPWVCSLLPFKGPSQNAFSDHPIVFPCLIPFMWLSCPVWYLSDIWDYFLFIRCAVCPFLSKSLFLLSFSHRENLFSISSHQSSLWFTLKVHLVLDISPGFSSSITSLLALHLGTFSRGDIIWKEIQIIQRRFNLGHQIKSSLRVVLCFHTVYLLSSTSVSCSMIAEYIS